MYRITATSSPREIEHLTYFYNDQQQIVLHTRYGFLRIGTNPGNKWLPECNGGQSL